MATALDRLQNDRNALGLLFLLPTAVLLLLFLTYPLGLGTWLGFTDTKIGRGGEWIGLENYEFLWGDSVTRLALFNTVFYTLVASVIKFVLGLWLALLLNKHLPFKAFLREEGARLIEGFMTLERQHLEFMLTGQSQGKGWLIGLGGHAGAPGNG